MIKNIFFDFDGVVAESVSVKTDAFFQLYLPYGREIAEQVKKHHLANGGMSRFKKFKLYHKELLGIDLTDTQVNELAEKFSQLVLDGVINADEVTGVRDFLENYRDKLNFWVISGTPTEEINIILERKKMSKYFVSAFGSPETKDYWVKKIVTELNINKDETVFIGDALADYEAANNNGIKFILRRTVDNITLFENIENISATINDFSFFYKTIRTL